MMMPRLFNPLVIEAVPIRVKNVTVNNTANAAPAMSANAARRIEAE